MSNHVLSNRLTGQEYLNFLQTDLPALLQVVPVDIRAGMMFQHDGAPPHFFRPVREYLDEIFPNRWIGRNGPVRWPARSPDLNPLDFFLWGHVKSVVYATPLENEAELMPRIQAAFDGIRNDPEVFQRVRRNMQRRCTLCLHERGRHFENKLPK